MLLVETKFIDLYLEEKTLSLFLLYYQDLAYYPERQEK